MVIKLLNKAIEMFAKSMQVLYNYLHKRQVFYIKLIERACLVEVLSGV